MGIPDHFSLAFEVSPIGMAIANQDGQLMRVNSSLCKLLGCRVEDLLQKQCGDLIHPADRDRHHLLMAQLLQPDSSPITTEIRYLTEQGGTLHTRLTLTLIYDAQQQAIGFTAQVLDLTERKQVEEALRISEDRFFKVFQASPDPIAIASFRNGQFLDINNSFLEVLGYRRNEVIGRTANDLNLWVNLKTRQQVRSLLRSQGLARNIECEYRTRSGAVRIFLLSSEIITLNGQLCTLSISKDITERKQAEKALVLELERQRLSAGMMQRIRQSLRLEDILQTTVQEIRQVLQCDRVLICQLQQDGSEWVRVESVSAGWCSVQGQILPPDSSLKDYLCRADTQGTLIDTDLSSSSITPSFKSLLQRFEVQARLVVPILQGEQPWGLIVAHQCSVSRQWQPFEVELLRQLSGQVAIAIQQSELYQQVANLNQTLEQQVQERTQQLQQAYEFEATLKRITDKVRDSLDEDQILQNAVEELGRAIGLQGCNAAIYDMERGTSQIKYEFTTLQAPFQGYTMIMANFSQGYRQLLEGQHFQCCGLIPYPNRDRMAMLACPIMDDQGVLGDLWLLHNIDYAFTEQDIRLTQQVANQCAIGIRQARLYQTAQAQVQELERLNRLKDDFLSTVSHELRTPMSNIKMATQMLELLLFHQTVKPLPSNCLKAAAETTCSPGFTLTDPQTLERAVRYFKILKDEGQREICLINDLLDLSRLDSSREPLSITQIQPQDWLPQVAMPFLDRAQEQHQTLEVIVSANLPSLSTDLFCLERIVTELLNNACKYTPEGKTIRVTATTPDLKTLHLQIANSGIEIAPIERDRIFEKFYRIPNNDPWKHGGTGLGLALVKKLVERLGGHIQVDAAEGWTIFTVVLPNLTHP